MKMWRFGLLEALDAIDREVHINQHAKIIIRKRTNEITSLAMCAVALLLVDKCANKHLLADIGEEGIRSTNTDQS